MRWTAYPSKTTALRSTVSPYPYLTTPSLTAAISPSFAPIPSLTPAATPRKSPKTSSSIDLPRLPSAKWTLLIPSSAKIWPQPINSHYRQLWMHAARSCNRLANPLSSVTFLDAKGPNPSHIPTPTALEMIPPGPSPSTS